MGRNIFNFYMSAALTGLRTFRINRGVALLRTKATTTLSQNRSYKRLFSCVVHPRNNVTLYSFGLAVESIRIYKNLADAYKSSWLTHYFAGFTLVFFKRSSTAEREST